MKCFFASLLLLGSACALNEDLHGWQATGPTPPNTKLNLHLSLTSNKTSELHELFEAVSDPTNTMYGQFLTQESLRHMCLDGVSTSAPVVEQWLNSNDVAFKRTGCGDMIELWPTVAQTESLFGVRMLTFEHADTTQSLMRTLSDITMPAEVAPHVTFVSGLFNFPHVNNLGSDAKPVGIPPPVTPDTLKKLYGLGTAKFSGKSNASQAVVEFQGQTIHAPDLTKFENKYNLPTQGIRTCTGGCTGFAGTESSLDVQYIIATGTGIPTDYHYNNAFDLVKWATWMQSEKDLALVWSVSYGEGINGGVGGVVKVSYAQGLNAQFEKIALLGHSILIASGDSGVYNRKTFEKIKFHPSFPAVLPAVTAVGATKLDSDGSENSAVDWSGGGFSPSTYFSQKDATFQNKAVQAYLSSGVHLPPSFQWDKNGRAIPDLAAVGVNYQVYIQGVKQMVSGTSASTPCVAGIIALLNDARLQAGKPPLGHINPFIYQNPSAFNDIVHGKNNNGGLLPGFEATKGWDPVTGLGTPKYPELLKAALAA